MAARPRAWVAEPEEAETVARLLVAFRDHHGRDWPSHNAFLAGVERLVADRDTEFLLATPDDDSPPAGVAQLRFRFSVWTATLDTWLEDLFVCEDARRRGVGDALVELAIDRGEARDARRIELDCNETNASALALYKGHGFSTAAKGGGGRDLFLGRPLGDAAG